MRILSWRHRWVLLLLAELITKSLSFDYRYRIRHGFTTTQFSRSSASRSLRPRITTATEGYNLQRRRRFLREASKDAAESSSPIISKDGLTATQEPTMPPSQTVLSATFGLMKAILGSGCLALPFGLAAMSNHPSSLVAANILLLTLGVLSAYTFSLYGRLAHATGGKSLGDIWKRVYSNTESDDATNKKNDSSWILSAANLIYCLGCCLTFSLVIGDSLSGLLQTTGMVSGIWATRQSSTLGVTAAVLLPLVQLQSLAALAPVSIVGVLGTIVIAAFMTIRCPAVIKSSPYAVASAVTKSKGLLFQTAPSAPSFGTYHRLQSPAPLVLVAMACVAWMAHFSAPDFYHSFTERQGKDGGRGDDDDDGASGSTATTKSNSNDSNALWRYNLTTALGYSLVAIVNAVILSTGFLTFGGSSMGMILNNYSPLDRGASLGRVLVLISMLGGFPFVFQGCLSSALDLATSKNHDQPIKVVGDGSGNRAQATERRQRQQMTAILMTFITTTSMLVQDAGFVVSFNGALMGTAIIYIFPALLFLKRTSSKTDAARSSKRLWLERAFSKFLVVFGGVSAVLGAVTAVLNSYFPHLLQ